jgi:hypothetical protein
MNTPDLQNAVRQALTQNAGGSPAQNQFQHGMNMQNAFMPRQHWNPDMQYAPDPLKGNPQAFVQEKPDSYFTVFPDPSRYAPQISQGQYNAMMQQDYGQNPNVNTGQQPQQAAPAESKYDYSKYISGDIWNTRVRNVSGKDWSERFLGDVGAGLSYGNFDNYSKYAPKAPGEDATQQDWMNYRMAQDLWDKGLSNAGSQGVGGYGMGKSKLDALTEAPDWSHLYSGYDKGQTFRDSILQGN